MRRVLATVAVVVAVVGIGVATGAVYVYGDPGESYAGITVGLPAACVGLEWGDGLAVFDCSVRT